MLKLDSFFRFIRRFTFNGVTVPDTFYIPHIKQVMLGLNVIDKTLLI